MLSGNTIVQFVSQYDWAKYILFANPDLSRYFNGIGPLMDGMWKRTFEKKVLFCLLGHLLGTEWFVLKSFPSQRCVCINREQ